MSNIILNLKFKDAEDIRFECFSFSLTELETFLILYDEDESPLAFFHTDSILGFTVHLDEESKMIENKDNKIVWN